jgi:hypothetical protein
LRANHSAAAGADAISLRAIELTALLRKRGAALQASNPKVRSWAERGISDAQALAALEVAEQRRHESASHAPINTGLLDAILGDFVAHHNARASPTPGRRRQTDADEREAVSIALTGRTPTNERTNHNAERDITAECQRIA